MIKIHFKQINNRKKMSDLVEIRADYEKVLGRKPPKSKSENEDWLVKQIDEEQSLYRKAETTWLQKEVCVERHKKVH